MTVVGGATKTKEAQSRNMINICIKYGFDSLIISGSYGEHRRHTTDDGRQTTDDARGIWHKLPTGELMNFTLYLSMKYYHMRLVTKAADADQGTILLLAMILALSARNLSHV